MHALAELIPEFISPAKVPKAIAQERERKSYRPTVVALASTLTSQMLVVQSPYEPNGSLSPPQGGLELALGEDDNPSLAVRRELKEEVTGIDIIYVGACLGGFRNDVPRKRTGFSTGKLYIVYDVLISEPCDPQPVEGETKVAKLLGLSDFYAQLQLNYENDQRRKPKAEALMLFTQLALGRR